MAMFVVQAEDGDALEAIVVRAVQRALAALPQRETSSPWLSLEKAAQYLDTTKDALAKAAQRGQVKAHRNGHGRWIFRVTDLDAFATAGDAR